MRYLAFGLFMLSLGCSLSICAADDGKPDWAVSGTHPEYPSPRFVLGVGIAPDTGDVARDRQLADKAALAEIVQQFRAAVSSQVSMETNVSTNGGAESVDGHYSSGASVQAALELDGLTIVERHFDSGERAHYSLGVIDRQKAGASFKRTLQREASDLRLYLAAAERSRAGGKPRQAIFELRDAYQAAARYRETLPNYQLIAGTERGGLEEIGETTTPAAILDRLSAILGGLRLEAAKGDRQAYAPNRAPVDPLSIRLAAGDHKSPAEGFVVEFRFRAGSGELSPLNARTDPNGMAQTSLTHLIPPQAGEPVILARLDLQEFKDAGPYRGEWNARLAAPGNVEFALVKARASTRVAIAVVGRAGERTSGAALRSALAARLADSGYVTVNAPALERAGERGITGKRLLDVVPKEAEVVLLAELSGGSAAQNMGMFVCRIQGTLNALNARDGRVLATVGIEDGRGFGTSAGAAREDAARNAGDELADAIAGALISPAGKY